MRSPANLMSALALTLALVSPAPSQSLAALDHQAPTTGLLDAPARLAVYDVPLSTALTSLYERSGVRVAFSPSILPNHLVSCKCARVSVGVALDRMLEGTRFWYSIVGEQILVEPFPEVLRTPQRGGTVFASHGGEGRMLVGLARTGVAGPVEPGSKAIQEGTVVGQVTTAGTGRPLNGVQVSVSGTGLGSLTDADGNYRIGSVPEGEVEIRAERIGYATGRRTVTVATGGTAVANFELRETAIGLDEIVVTGTAGGTQRRAIGNVVASLDADALSERSPIVEIDDLISQRTPGVIMLPSTGQIGTGANVRIRGISSITQGAEPIIYIDGVRMDSNVGGSGGAVSRLNDIPPGDIERIEIIKGPAAATLYGTEASNGVIQIITKRGAAGASQIDVTMRLGTNWMWNPEGRAGLRYMRDPDNPDEIIGVNVYEQERLHGTGPIYGYGPMQGINVRLGGGTDAIRYFASFSGDEDVGIVDHNWDKRISARANLEAVLTEGFTAAVSTAYIQGQIRLSEGVAAVRPFRNLVWAIPDNTAARGWRTSPPEEWDKVETRADNDRTTASVELRYQPVSWSTHRLVTGLDVNSEVNWTLVPRMPEETMHFYGALGRGFKSVSRGTRKLATIDYAGSANFGWRAYSFQPSIGFQYYKTQSSFIDASGNEFPAVPITTVSGGAARSGGEFFSENSTVGLYVQQQIGWNDRAFVTAAIRGDDNSAFGEEYDAAIYPKLSAAWVISEEPFWPVEAIDQLRLRAAWGAAGQQPGTFDAARLYTPAIGYQNQPALSPGSFGNPQLKPERSEELEVGFDASVLDGRLDLEFTHYNKATRDAIINRPLPPSSGFTGSQIVNIGLINNWGNEFGMVAHLIEGRRFAWDLDTQLASTKNEIESLGDLDVIFAGTQSQHRPGYSIADLFMLNILEAEIDEDGQVLSTTCDGGTGPQGVDPGGPPVPCSEAPQVWLGHTQPTWQVGVGNTFTFWNDLRLYARVEGNGGHKHVATEIRATHNLGTTEAVLRGDNPFLQAYRVLENDRTGVYEAGFLRLREVSLSYTAPPALAARLRASRASISLGMRNVAMLWTAAHGWSTPRDGHVLEPLAGMTVWDPETRGTGSTSVGFQQNVPQTASATMSIRLSF